MICQGSLQEANKYLDNFENNAWTHRGLALSFYKKYCKQAKKEELTLKEKWILRKYYYKQRLEIWEIIGEELQAQDIVRIDFNHLYLNMMKTPLPIKKKNTQSGSGDLGFYYIKFYAPKGTEPVLPTIENHVTFFKTGLGKGIYWSEEIQYFISRGGVVIEKKPIILYETTSSELKPLMEVFYTIPKRHVRKQLANQFYGNLGRKSWQYTYKLLHTDDLVNWTGGVRRTKFYGAYVLTESPKIKYVRRMGENLSWALVVATRARILIHQLMDELINKGAQIIYINMDELLIKRNTLSPDFLKTNNKAYKITNITPAYLETIKIQQWDLIYKRQTNPNVKLKRSPWHTTMEM